MPRSTIFVITNFSVALEVLEIFHFKVDIVDKDKKRMITFVFNTTIWAWIDWQASLGFFTKMGLDK